MLLDCMMPGMSGSQRGTRLQNRGDIEFMIVMKRFVIIIIIIVIIKCVVLIIKLC